MSPLRRFLSFGDARKEKVEQTQQQHTNIKTGNLKFDIEKIDSAEIHHRYYYRQKYKLLINKLAVDRAGESVDILAANKNIPTYSLQGYASVF